MKVNWAAVAQTGIRVASVIVPQIGLIEQVATALPGLQGKAKEDAVVVLTQEALRTAETVVSKDLVGDAEFEEATRQFIRAYVALQNVINSRKQ